MKLQRLSNMLATAGHKHILVQGKQRNHNVNVVTASEDTLIGLWTGWNIILPDSTHGPIPTAHGIKGTIPAKVLYDDNTMTYRAFQHTGDVTDWREGFNRTYCGRPDAREIELANNKREG